MIEAKINYQCHSDSAILVKIIECEIGPTVANDAAFC